MGIPACPAGHRQHSAEVCAIAPAHAPGNCRRPPRGPSRVVGRGFPDPATRAPRTSKSCSRARRQERDAGANRGMRTPDLRLRVARLTPPAPVSRRRGSGGGAHHVEEPELSQRENDTRVEVMTFSAPGDKVSRQCRSLSSSSRICSLPSPFRACYLVQYNSLLNVRLERHAQPSAH